MAAVASATSAAAAWLAVRRAGRGADFASCLDVLGKLAEAQRRVRDADTDDKKLFEQRELLNLMEALAGLDNRKRVAPTTSGITRKFLIEAYAFMESQPQTHPLLESSITSSTTFDELVKFAKKHATRIEQLKAAYAQATSSTVSS